MKQHPRRLILALGANLFLYLAIYTVLSVQGEYVPSQSGNIRYPGGFSATDIRIWHPLGCRYQPKYINVDGTLSARGNSLGRFFAPLIMVDQKWFHKTQNYFETPEG